MTQTGIIEAVENDYAKIRIKRTSACGDNCGSCAGCNNLITVYAKNMINADVGDRVFVEMSNDVVLKAALIVYLVPIIAMIAGYFIGSILFDVEWKCIVTGLAAMCTAVIAEIVYSQNKRKNYQPVITKIIQ